jgi:hypothetical protein
VLRFIHSYTECHYAERRIAECRGATKTRAYMTQTILQP